MKKIAPIKVSAEIDKREYIQIPGHDALISMFEPEEFKGYNWDEMHIKAGEKRLQMAPPSLFIPSLVNVIKAHNRKSVLYDGLGNPLSEERAEEVYTHLISGAWSYLDAKYKFDKKAGIWHIQTDHQIIKEKDERIFTFRESPLRKCLMEPCFVNLRFNSQGLPTERSEYQEYKQGENIHFYPPRDDSVAWFVADSDGAYLNCYRYASNSSPALGVYVVARKI